MTIRYVPCFRDREMETGLCSQETTGLEGSQPDNPMTTNRSTHGDTHMAVSSTDKPSRRWVGMAFWRRERTFM